MDLLVQRQWDPCHVLGCLLQVLMACWGGLVLVVAFEVVVVPAVVAQVAVAPVASAPVVAVLVAAGLVAVAPVASALGA